MSDERSLTTDLRLYAILSLVAVGVLGGTIVSPTFSGMANEFGVTESRVTLTMTAFFLPAVVAIPIVGALADAWRRRPIVLWSLLVYGLAGAAIGLVDSFAAVLALRAVQGCAFPGTLPLSVAVIGDLYRGGEATRAQGFRTSVNGLASIGAPLIAGVAAATSWRAPYGMYALAFLALAVCYVALPESEDSPDGSGEAPARIDGSAERPDGPTDRASDSSDRSPDSGRLPAVDPTRAVAAIREVGDALTRPILLVMATMFTVFFVRYALISFVPLYLASAFDAGETVAGVAVAIVGLGRFAVAPTAGRIVDRFDRRTTLIGGLGVFAGGTALLAAAPNSLTLLLVIGLLSVGEGAYNPVANDFITAAAPTGVRGRVVSVLESGKTVAIAAAPVVFGAVLAASSFRALFLLGGGLAAVAAAVVARAAVR